jgi:hypothetical protein
MNGDAAGSFLPQTLATTQSLQGLQWQRTPRTDRFLHTTHSHTKEQYNKIINSTPIFVNRNTDSTKLIYSSKLAHGYKER